METRIYLELDSESKTGLYALPVDSWNVPLGAVVPTKGDRLTFAVFKLQAEPEILEPREFEVVDRSMYLQMDVWAEARPLTRNEVTLVLRDLGPVMVNEQGFGALGAQDPVVARRKAGR